MSNDKCPMCGAAALDTVARNTAPEEVPAKTCAANCGWHERHGLFFEEQLSARDKTIADLEAACKLAEPALTAALGFIRRARNTHQTQMYDALQAIRAALAALAALKATNPPGKPA